MEESLAALERSLAALRERYTQLQATQAEQTALEQHRQDLEKQWQANQLPELEQELHQIQEQLTEINLTLESRLVPDEQLQAWLWQGLRRGILGELFWQIVRWGGLGVAIGWWLKTWAG
ncbi:MAG: DUF2203 domain-containing protein [Microcystaceae cyanobacterium]